MNPHRIFMLIACANRETHISNPTPITIIIVTTDGATGTFQSNFRYLVLINVHEYLSSTK